MRKALITIAMALAALVLGTSCKPDARLVPGNHPRTPSKAFSQEVGRVDRVETLTATLRLYQRKALNYEALLQRLEAAGVQMTPTDDIGAAYADGSIGVDCDSPLVWCDDEGR